MKKVFPYLIICFVIVIGFYLIDRQDETPPTPPPLSSAEQWENWEDEQKILRRDVLDVLESRQWLAKHGDAISIPKKIDFLENHYLTESPFQAHGIGITTDHYGRYRVFAWSWPPPWPPEGFLTETDSITWLKAEGYHVEKTHDGYVLKRSQAYMTHNANVSIDMTVKVYWGDKKELQDGTIVKTNSEKSIVIKVSGK